MAARQTSQGSNAMLYTVVTFVALFLIAAVLAVVYYVKAEDYRIQADQGKEDLRSIVTPGEKGKLLRIVGKPTQGKSYMGTMQTVIDDLYSFILGQQPLENLPTTVKFNEISMKIAALNEDVLGADVNPAIGPSGVALLTTIEELKDKLDKARSEVIDIQQINEKLNFKLEEANTQNEQEKQNYLTELGLFQTEVDEIRDSFDELKTLMDDTTTEQATIFAEKIDAERDKLQKKQLDLQNTEKN